MGGGYSISLFLVFSLAAFRLGIGFGPQSDETVSFQWLDASGETAGLIYSTHQMRPLSLQPDIGALVEIEQEESRLDSQTTRKIRRIFSNSVNGERRLAEMIVEDVKKKPDGSIHAERTTSRPDTNGRSMLVQKEIQEMAPTGTDLCRITKTLLLSGANNALVEKERIQQIEKQNSDKSVEIDRTSYIPGQNGIWSVTERRVSHNSLSSERTQTEEQVYQNDVNNRLSMTQQLKINEWKDSAGQRHWRSESYTPNLEGGFQLSSRLTMVQTALQNGRQETTEILERPSQAAPKEGLKLIQKIVEELQVRNSNETERQLEVLEPDLNGDMRSVKSWQGLEVK